MIQSDLIKFENWIKCADSTVPEMHTYTRKLLHLKFNLQFIRYNSFLLLCCCIAVYCLLALCCCIKKEGLLQSWNCSIVHIKAKRQGRIVLHCHLIWVVYTANFEVFWFEVSLLPSRWTWGCNHWGAVRAFSWNVMACFYSPWSVIIKKILSVNSDSQNDMFVVTR